MAWVRLMQDGGPALRQALGLHTDLNQQEQRLVDQARAFDEAWNQTWNSFASAGRNAFLTVKSGLNDLASISARVRAYFNPNDANSQIANRFGSFGGAPNNALQTALQNRARQLRGERTTADPNWLAHTLALEGQWVAVIKAIPIKKSEEGQDRDSTDNRKAA